MTRFKDDDIVLKMDAEIRADIHKAYPDMETDGGDELMDCLIRIAEATGDRFFFIIDEWDALCRDFKPGSKSMDEYVNWLRRMFKDVSANNVFVGVYMTGILPIKKYNTQSALNNFTEYSMVDPVNMAQYFGFTRDEVKTLSEKNHVDFDDLVKWYDGYQIGAEHSMFNPNSVMQAMYADWCTSY